MNTKVQSMNKVFILLLFGFSFVLHHPCYAGPEVPGAKQSQPIALVGADIYPVSQPMISEGILLFENGRITAMGTKVKLPENTKVINVRGKRIYPSFIEPISSLGLVEINAVRATRDYRETGDINPNVRAATAINPDSELLPVTRSNGVLVAVAAPSGGIISGRSAVIMLDGWTWEDMTLKADAALHIQWPAMSPVVDWHDEKSAKEQIAERDSRLKKLTKACDDALQYQKARAVDSTLPRDARHEGLLPSLRGDTPVIVHANALRQIEAAVAFCQKYGMKMILHGGYDAPRCAALLKSANIPVIIGGVHRLPNRRDDRYDAAYTLPARLDAMGVEFCISGNSRFGASNVRNLPYQAATAAAYGLKRELALRAITLSAAEILGVDEHVGSLAIGKDATLFVCDGDPLETPTQVESAWIQGRRVDLDNRHKRLNRKYEQKYQRK